MALSEYFNGRESLKLGDKTQNKLKQQHLKKTNKTKPTLPL